MLTQLLKDAQALAADLPAMQTAIDAVQTDLATPSAINTKQLAADASTLSEAVDAVETAITALQADLNSLPQATAPDDLAETITSAISAAAGNTRLQNLICLALPYLNLILAAKGFPAIPTPAFCGQ